MVERGRDSIQYDSKNDAQGWRTIIVWLNCDCELEGSRDKTLAAEKVYRKPISCNVDGISRGSQALLFCQILCSKNISLG